MAPVECKIWMRSTSKDPSEARTTSARPAFFRLTRIRCDAGLWCRSSATGDEFCIKIALCRLDFDPVARKASAGAASGASRRPDDPPDGVEGKLHAERRLVERDLFLATDLVGQLFPRRGDVVGAGLRVVLAGEDLGQLVFRYAVVLENAGNARLDRTVWVTIGAELRVQIRRDVLLVVACRHPFVDVGMTCPVNLAAGRIHHGPEREILATDMRCGTPRRLVLAFVAVDPRHDVNAPTEIGAVGRMVWTARELLPAACLGIVDVVRAGQDVEPDDVADHGGVARFRYLADISPPGDHRADAGQELLEAGGVRIGVELIGRLGRQRVDDVLNGANPGRIVDVRLHRVNFEHPSLVVRMLRVSRGAAAEEIEAEPTPGLRRIEVTERILALDFLAFEELGHGLDLLPGLRHAPFALVASVVPGLGQIGVGEIVGPVVEVMAVAVDGDSISLAVPGTDRRLQVVHIIVDIDLLLDPVRHLRRQALAAHIAFERGTHFKDVEVDRAGRDRLLQSRVVVSLSEVDPGNFRSRIGLPRFQETAEKQVVQILIVESHKGEFDALELALLDVRLGWAEAKLADLLPIGVGWSAFAYTWHL